MGTVRKFLGVSDIDIDEVCGVAIEAADKIIGEDVKVNPDGTFSFDVTTAGADTFELPILAGGAGYEQTFSVDWGDTNSSTITSYDDADRTHSYAGAGTYTVVLDGVSEWFAFNDAGDKTLVVELNAFTGDMGFQILNFYGCSNLHTICSLGVMRYLQHATNMFRACASIQAIQSGMFDDCYGMNAGDGFSYTFSGCSDASLTTIPSGLFDNQPHLTTDAFSYTFQSCDSITSIPADLFKFNTAVTTTAFKGTFESSGITSIVSGLFDYNTAVTTDAFFVTFRLCLGLTSIPSDLFKFNTAISSSAFQSLFSRSENITSIVSGLFDYNVNITSDSFKYTFYWLLNLTAIVADLFKFNIAVSTTAFLGTFDRAETFTSIVADLFKFNTAITTNAFTDTFLGCDDLTTIVADLFRYNTAITTTAFYRTFYDCNSLVTATSDIFRYNTSVSTGSFYRLFYSCELYTGGARFWYNTSAVSFVATFRNCIKMRQSLTIFCDIGDEDTRFHDQDIDFTSCFDRDSFTGTKGASPALWDYDFGSGTPTTTDCWEGAGNSLTSLENYSDIPVGWK